MLKTTRNPSLHGITDTESSPARVPGAWAIPVYPDRAEISVLGCPVHATSGYPLRVQVPEHDGLFLSQLVVGYLPLCSSILRVSSTNTSRL